MIGPKKGVPAEQFTLRNSSGRDIRFKGWKLAGVDNYNPHAVSENRQPAGSKRWKERAVYQTEGGKTVCHKLGRSNVPGEVDRGEVLVVKTDEDVRRENAATAEFSSALGPAKKAKNRLVIATAKPADQQIIDFFDGDALAKDLLGDLGIADVEDIDGPAPLLEDANGEPVRKSYIVDIPKLPPMYPTHRHAPAFWTSLGRAVATFGFLEEILAKAIFALTGSREAPSDAAALKAVLADWNEMLEKALSNTLFPLIDSFGKAAREHPGSRHENLEDLLGALREAARVRNVICHGSWRPSNAVGASIPFFVNRQQQIFETAVDCRWLDQLQRHTAELSAEVINTVTHMGYQFPGSSGPGRPL